MSWRGSSVRGAAAAFLGLVVAFQARAAEPLGPLQLQGRGAGARRIVDGERRGPSAALVLDHAERDPLEWIWHVARPADMGSGGDVSGLEAQQFRYSDPTDGNLVVLFWREETANPAGVVVFMDGTRLGVREGLPAEQLPATNNVGIPEVPAGRHTFRIEAGGTSDDVEIVVLDVQPFADPTDVKCEGTTWVDPSTGQCDRVVTWSHAGAPVTGFLIFIDDNFRAEAGPDQRQITFFDVSPGNYSVNVEAFLVTPDGVYRGQSTDPEALCEITCEDLPCNAPGLLGLCQMAYGPTAPENVLRADWENGELEYAAGVIVLKDGTPAPGSPLPGDTELAAIPDFTPGTHKVGVQGDCGPDGQSAVLEEEFLVVSETPHTNPITGPLACVFNPETQVTTLTWTNADPSRGIDVFLTLGDGSGPFYIGTMAGTRTTVDITMSEATDTYSLIFYAFFNGFCYGSEPVTCNSEPVGTQYIQGVCDGEGNTPAITSAIFGLNHLFLGGPAPPCQKACDADGNGEFNLSDMVYVLNFLFNGGPSPTLWGGTTPVCTSAAPEDDCEIPNESCPL